MFRTMLMPPFKSLEAMLQQLKLLINTAEKFEAPMQARKLQEQQTPLTTLIRIRSLLTS